MNRLQLNNNNDGLQVNISGDEIVNVFHCLYYLNESRHSGPPILYHGVPIHKLPGDLFNYQQIIFDQKPDYIIECGAYQGGSTLYFAHQLDLINKGKIISIDICEREENWYPQVREHERTVLIEGSSVDQAVVQQVKDIVGNSRNNLVILDSLHTKPHVLQEMLQYSDLLSSGNYMIVEDSNLNGHPLPPDWHSATKKEGGPFEALVEFFKINDKFRLDQELEKRFMFSYCPSGYLVKK